ncbi:hypothetical protein RWH44_04320 [Microbacterium sp. KSW2-29]|uniref:PPE family domain-containing protein n=1 Tax=Microbacterium phycohabitans TaxID=3075993 RepID=A0ABU3SJY7_9MICO|nr:hypothetical protein [Microbacterium sp. KSW2-29]MDU0344921.1 hypothetical protein [Microbacterium sp. KSW2-29]
MTGTWEQRLQNLAEGGVPWDMPTRYELANALEALRQVLDAASKDTGIGGDAGDAARAKFAASVTEVDAQIQYLRDHVNERLIDANDVRRQARDSAASLPPGEMNGNQEAMVRGAAAGASIVFGPVAFLAGEGASRAINGYMASQREEAARTAVEKHSDQMDAIEMREPPAFSSTVISSEPTSSPSSSEVPAGGYGAQQRSFESYPDWDMSGGGAAGGGNGGGTATPPPGGGGGGGGLQPPPSEYGPFPNPPGQTPGGQPPIDIGNVPPDPTPDGPISGSPTLPGGIPMVPGGGGGGLVGTPGGPGAGLGSGLGAGLIAGGGGALALGRVGGGAGAPGVPGGRLFGGPAGGSVGAGGAGGARSGGLLGRPGAGAGLGTRGVGGLGAAGTGSANSTARGAGARAGGLGAAGTRAGGVGGAGGSATGTSGGRAAAANGRAGVGAAGGSGAGAAGTGRTAGAGSRGVGGMGGPGSRSERKKDEARGLAGPIAPRMEDDEEIGPRSENAQAGGRDE